MGAPTEIYVDPAGNADSGSGTIGDPYLDLQHALNSVTRDATNGNRFNIKAGTDEVLAASLTLATYGTPTHEAPLILQGYTSAAGDGGIGGISGAGSFTMWTSTAYDYIRMIDLHLHNTGNNNIVRLDIGIYLINCQLDNNTGDYGAFVTTGFIVGCSLVNSSAGQAGLMVNTDGVVAFNYSANTGGRTMLHALRVNGASNGTTYAIGNIVSVGGSTNGVMTQHMVYVSGNSIYSAGGTGKGITVAASGRPGAIVVNNIIEGFSGTGGIGFDHNGSDWAVKIGNAAYNNATNYETGSVDHLAFDNETLGASAFNDAANGDFTVDTSVKATAFPTMNFAGLSVRTYLDKGALQREEAGGDASGGLLTHLGMTGGMRG